MVMCLYGAFLECYSFINNIQDNKHERLDDICIEWCPSISRSIIVIYNNISYVSVRCAKIKNRKCDNCC